MNPIAMPLVNTNNVKQIIGCTKNECKNGAICYKLSVNGHQQDTVKCKCPLGYSGTHCETLQTVNFKYEDSYLELETPELEHSFNITFSIVTEAEQGMLLYHGSRGAKHLAIELFKGRVRVSHNIGNTPVQTLFSYVKLNDKKERRVEILLNAQNLTLRITDSNELRSISSPGKQKYLNVGYEPLYVGGVPNSIKDRITKQLLHVRNATSLRGCLTHLYINSELRDLSNIEYSHKMKPGCGYMEACSRVGQCLNGGRCSNAFSLKSDYECACASGFTGKSCEIKMKNNNLNYRAVALSSKKGFACANNVFTGIIVHVR